MDLKDKVAIISGASRGIGRAVALLLAQHGMRIVLVARNEHELQSLQQEIHAQGGKAISVAASVTEESGVQQVVGATMSVFGRIDVLVNNAGMGIFKKVEDISAEDWDIVMGVNAKGTFLLSKAVLPHLKTAGQGFIVNIASDVSRRTFANGSLYCASKFAQDAFASALRKEVRPFGIKVSVIYPGLTDTYFNGTEQGEERKKDWLRAEDIAEAVWYVLNAPRHVVVDELMIHPISQEY